jgi:hypothetical protein
MVKTVAKTAGLARYINTVKGSLAAGRPGYRLHLRINTPLRTRNRSA